MSKIPEDFRKLWLPYTFKLMTAACNARHEAEAAEGAKAQAKGDYDWSAHIMRGGNNFYPRAREHTYLPVNRWYKPLGCPNEYVDYLDYSKQFIRFTVDPHKIPDVWFGSREDNRALGLYLYYGNRRSQDTYGERYGRLLSFMDIDWRDIRGDRRTRDAMREAGLVGA